jgi:hypothetical protein
MDLLPARNRRECRLLLDLLAGRQSSIETIDLDRFLAITPVKLQPFLHWRLQSIHTPLPKDLFAKKFFQNGLLHLRRLAELRRIGNAFQREGVDYIVLKGPVLASLAYPEVATRPMLDLDLLVRDRQMTRAREILETLDYSVPLQFVGSAMNHGDAPPMANLDLALPTVELHSEIDSAPGSEWLESAWSSRTSADLGGGVTVPVLDRAEFFAQVALHASKHHVFEFQLLQLLDVARLLESSMAEFDWASALVEWRRRGIERWIALTVTLAHRLLDAPLPMELPVLEEKVVGFAAAQLWLRPEDAIPWLLLSALAGRRPARDRHGARHSAPMFDGVRGARLRVERNVVARARRFVTHLRTGTLSPRNVMHQVRVVRQRYRLLKMMDGGGLH